MSILDLDLQRSCERVATGAAWMDEHHPGWERRIDLSTFDIGRTQTCVCGQVIGPSGYTDILMDQGSEWLDEHGFSYNIDQDQWVLLLKERFDSGMLSDAVDQAV